MSFFASRWIDAARARDRGRRRGAAAGFRAGRSPPGCSPTAASTSGCSSATPRTSSAPRASRARASSRRRCSSLQERAASTRCAPSSSTPATPTPRPAARGSTRPRACRAPRRWPSGVEADRVAVASTGVIGVPLDGRAIVSALARLRRGCTSRRRRRLRHGDHDDRRVRQARRAEGGAAVRDGAADGAGQGRRDDPAGLRDDAVLRPDRRGARARDRRPAARRLRQALLRPHLRRRPAVDERHGDPAVLGRERRARSRRSPRTSCASARRSTRCCGCSRC